MKGYITNHHQNDSTTAAMHYYNLTEKLLFWLLVETYGYIYKRKKKRHDAKNGYEQERLQALKIDSPKIQKKEKANKIKL